MKKASNPYREIKRKRREAIVEWASRSFAGGSTFRMFAVGDSNEIRKFLCEEIGDCGKLVRVGTQEEYDKQLFKLIGKLRTKIRLNRNSRGRKVNFGQAAKVINLYIKQFLLFPDFMSLRCPKDHLYRLAHVPLDRVILDHIWRDFGTQMEAHKIKRKPALRDLDQRIYTKLQSILAEAARDEKMARLAYDFRWATRES